MERKVLSAHVCKQPSRDPQIQVKLNCLTYFYQTFRVCFNQVGVFVGIHVSSLFIVSWRDEIVCVEVLIQGYGTSAAFLLSLVKFCITIVKILSCLWLSHSISDFLFTSLKSVHIFSWNHLFKSYGRTIIFDTKYLTFSIIGKRTLYKTIVNIAAEQWRSQQGKVNIGRNLFDGSRLTIMIWSINLSLSLYFFPSNVLCMLKIVVYYSPSVSDKIWVFRKIYLCSLAWEADTHNIDNRIVYDNVWGLQASLDLT